MISYEVKTLTLQIDVLRIETTSPADRTNHDNRQLLRTQCRWLQAGPQQLGRSSWSLSQGIGRYERTAVLTTKLAVLDSQPSLA